MFEMRTNSHNASLTSPFVTRPHHSNLYGRIERFVRFLRASHAPTRTSLVVRIVVVDCARGLRPWIAPMDCALGLRPWIAPVNCARGLRPWIAPVRLGDVRDQVLAKRVSITRLRILLIVAQSCAWLCEASTLTY